MSSEHEYRVKTPSGTKHHSPMGVLLQRKPLPSKTIFRKGDHRKHAFEPVQISDTLQNSQAQKGCSMETDPFSPHLHQGSIKQDALCRTISGMVGTNLQSPKEKTHRQEMVKKGGMGRTGRQPG